MTSNDFLFTIGYIATDFLNYSLCYFIVFGFSLRRQAWRWLASIAFVIILQCIFSKLANISVARNLCFITMLTIPIMLVSGKKREIFSLYPFIYFGMSCIGIAVSFIISALLKKNVNEVINNYFLTVFCEMIPALSLIIIFFAMKIKKKAPWKVHLGKKTYILFFIGTICTFLILGSYQNLSKLVDRWEVLQKNEILTEKSFFTDKVDSDLSNVTAEGSHSSYDFATEDSELIPENLRSGIFLAAISCVVIIYLILWHGIATSKELNYRKQIHDMKEFSRIRENYFQEVSSHNEAIRRFRHDMKAHLATLYGFCQSQDINGIEDYLQTISDDKLLKAPKEYTNDKGVDAIINSLYNHATIKNIAIKINGSIKFEKDISSFEMSSLFYNLTTNAIEACEKLLNDSEKYILIEMGNFNKHIIIRIINPVLKKIDIKNGHIETDKDDNQNHGLGIKNVTDIVRKYNGTLSFECDDTVFKAEIMI